MMRRALLLLIGSIVLCSCAARPAPLYVTVPVVACPAPIAPELPEINGALPLDGPGNVEALMLRDDLLRGYIGGLRACVECYERQTTQADPSLREVGDEAIHVFPGSRTEPGLPRSARNDGKGQVDE
jgi:hypothetical protein